MITYATLNMMMFLSLANNIAVEERISPTVLTAICLTESGGNTRAVSLNDGVGNSMGVCQIKLGTASMVGYKGNEAGLINLKTNLRYAARYIKKLQRRYGDGDCVIAAYNYGHCRLNAKGLIWNRSYVRRVHAKFNQGGHYAILTSR